MCDDGITHEQYERMRTAYMALHAAATQVAATVNKSEITIHQINAVLQRAGALPPEQVKQASGQALERLIDQELLVQQAIEKKLDRSVAVVQAVEAARREIYARAYLEQITSPAGKPDGAAITAYYNANPALFAKRRIYDLKELNVQVPDERIPALRQEISDAKDIEEVENWLRGEGIPFKANAGIRAAEQLPLELLPRFAAAADGEAVLTQVPDGLVISYIVASREQPLDEKAAAPLIEQLLANKRAAELVQAELKRLRQASTIEYQGEFAKVARANPTAGLR